MQNRWTCIRSLGLALLILLALVSSCDKKREPILEETVSFENNSIYFPFELYKEGQRVTVYAKIHIKYITTSEYKFTVILTNPEGEVMSTDVSRIPEGEVNPMDDTRGGMVELKRHEATDEYRLFSFITKNGSYDIEFLRDMGFSGAEMDNVKISIVPQ